MQGRINNFLKVKANTKDEELNLLSIYLIKATAFFKSRKKFLYFLSALVLVFCCFESGVVGISYNVYVNEKFVGKIEDTDQFFKRTTFFDTDFGDDLKIYPSLCFMKKTTPMEKVEENILLEVEGVERGDKTFEFDNKKNISEEKESVAVALPEENLNSGFSAPISAPVSSWFGERWGREHKGVDFAANEGEDVYAADGGVVKYSDFEETFGNLVIIEHGNGYDSYYAHLKSRNVSVGEMVSPGQKIGEVGNTGNSTGPHLHFEIRKGGKALNPTEFIAFG